MIGDFQVVVDGLWDVNHTEFVSGFSGILIYDPAGFGRVVSAAVEKVPDIMRLQNLEEERRILTAHVRELRDPARLAELAQEMGLSRPDRVIALAPPGDESRP